MKKVLGIVVIIMMIVLIVIVAVNMNGKLKMSVSSNTNLTKNDKIDFSAVEVTNKYVKFSLTNNTNTNIFYGADYQIEKFIDGVWYCFDIAVDFVEIQYILEPGESHEETVYFGRTIGVLNKGKYRLIKNINNNLEYTEFTIE